VDFFYKENVFNEKDLEKMGFDLESMSKKEKEDLLDRKFYEFLYDGWEALNYGEVVPSRKIFRMIIKKVPECVDAYNGMGASYLEDGKLKDAHEYYKKAYELTLEQLGGKIPEELLWGILDNRPYLRAMHGLGLVLWRKNKAREAKEIFETMLRINTNDNQGIRFILQAMDEGLDYEEFMRREGGF
jgi:tetratricopeptide (TPR) repeat protein